MSRVPQLSSRPVLRLDLLPLLPLSAWRAFFATFAPTLPAPADCEAVARALSPSATVDPPPSLIAALHTLRLFSNDDGHAALLRAATDAQLDTSSWPRGDSPALALHLLLEAERDARLKDVFASARFELSELPHSEPCYELGATDPERVRCYVAEANLTQRLASLLAPLLEADGRLPDVTVRLVRDDASELALDVLRADHARRVIASDEAAGLPAVPRTLVARRSDLVRLDKARGRLCIATRATSLPEILRRAMGTALFGDARFFSDAASIDLRPLLDKKQDALKVPALSALIAGARVIEMDWDSGEDDVLAFHGRDVLQAIERRGTVLSGGTIERATIRLDFTDDGPKADITLALPHGLTVHPEERRELATRFTDLAGLTSNAPRADDLWSLVPWVHDQERWRLALGGAFEAFVKAGVLQQEHARMLVAPEMPGAGRALLAFPVPGKRGVFFATSRNRAVAPRTVKASALVVYRLDLDAYAARVASELGTDARPTATELFGVIDLGSLTLGQRVVRLVLVAAPAAARDLQVALRRSAKRSADVALLVPRGRALATSDLSIELSSIAGPHREPVLTTLRDAFGMTLAKSRKSKATSKPRRWLLDRAAGRVSLDKVDLDAPDLVVRFLLVLAEREGETLPGKDVSLALAPARLDLQVAKEAKRKLQRAIEIAFRRANKRPPEELVVSDRRGYRLLGGVDIRD